MVLELPVGIGMTLLGLLGLLLLPFEGALARRPGAW